MNGEISTALEDWFAMEYLNPEGFGWGDIVLAPPPRIVGLDLSLAATGISTAQQTRALDTPAKSLDGPRRLAYIRDVVLGAVLCPRAECVVLEGYSFGSRQGGEKLGELGGVIRVALYEQGVPFVEVAPSTLKIFATGRGNAKKPEVIANARERLGYEGFDDNAADALWLRALGMAGYGAPLAELPKTHLRALEKIRWPVRVER